MWIRIRQLQSNKTPKETVMSDIKISIIMPVYKVEEYVGKAIESILAQTFTEFEFLIVDDGTPDRSGEICDRIIVRPCATLGRRKTAVCR